MVIPCRGEPLVDALEMECVVAFTPHHCAVISRELCLWWAAIERRPADPADIISCEKRENDQGLVEDITDLAQYSFVTR